MMRYNEFQVLFLSDGTVGASASLAVENREAYIAEIGKICDSIYGEGNWLVVAKDQTPADLSGYTITDGVLTPLK